MVKQSSPQTATDWIKRKFYGSDWGIHSPEIIKSPFDAIMESYMRMAGIHRQMAIDGRNYPNVYFNEHGEIVRIKKPHRFDRDNKSLGEEEYYDSMTFEDLYRNIGFFFEGEE